MNWHCEVRLRRRSKLLLTALLVITITDSLAQPAFSQAINYFSGSRPDLPYAMMVGSAPSPTPDDLCAAGATSEHCYTDATKTQRKRFVPNPKIPGHYREYRPGDDKLIENQIKARRQVGREIFGLGGSIPTE